jgi:hypothetical protein
MVRYSPVPILGELVLVALLLAVVVLSGRV